MGGWCGGEVERLSYIVLSVRDERRSTSAVGYASDTELSCRRRFDIYVWVIQEICSHLLSLFVSLLQDEIMSLVLPVRTTRMDD